MKNLLLILSFIFCRLSNAQTTQTEVLEKDFKNCADVLSHTYLGLSTEDVTAKLSSEKAKGSIKDFKGGNGTFFFDLSKETSVYKITCTDLLLLGGFREYIFKDGKCFYVIFRLPIYWKKIAIKVLDNSFLRSGLANTLQWSSADNSTLYGVTNGFDTDYFDVDISLNPKNSIADTKPIKNTRKPWLDYPSFDAWLGTLICVEKNEPRKRIGYKIGGEE